MGHRRRLRFHRYSLFFLAGNKWQFVVAGFNEKQGVHGSRRGYTPHHERQSGKHEIGYFTTRSSRAPVLVEGHHERRSRTHKMSYFTSAHPEQRFWSNGFFSRIVSYCISFRGNCKSPDPPPKSPAGGLVRN